MKGRKFQKGNETRIGNYGCLKTVFRSGRRERTFQGRHSKAIAYGGGNLLFVVFVATHCHKRYKKHIEKISF
jgi:hypothetical protein